MEMKYMLALFTTSPKEIFRCNMISKQQNSLIITFSIGSNTESQNLAII